MNFRNYIIYSPDVRKDELLLQRYKKQSPSLTKQEILNWLDRQPISQKYKIKPKTASSPRYTQDKPIIHSKSIYYF